MQKIDIIGAGPGGLFAALLLRRQRPGCRVVVHERRQRGQDRGLGIILHGNILLAFLMRDEVFGRQIAERVRIIDRLSVRHRGGLHAAGERHLYSLSRQMLVELLVERCLAEGVEICWGHNVRSLASLEDAGDLVLLADGARSQFRDAHAETFRPSYVEYEHRYLWMYADVAFDSFEFDLRETADGVAVLHGYPYAADRSSAVIEMSATAASKLAQRCGSPEALATSLSRTFEQTLQGRALQLPNMGNGVAWERFYTVRCERWVMRQGDQRVALLGDAARTAHFSIGSGTRLALGDALVLADALEGVGRDVDLDTALQRYAEVRQEVSVRVQRKAELSMQWFQQVDDRMHWPVHELGHSLLTRSEEPTADGVSRAVQGVDEATASSVLYLVTGEFGLLAAHAALARLAGDPGGQLLVAGSERAAVIEALHAAAREAGQAEPTAAWLARLHVTDCQAEALGHFARIRARSLGLAGVQWLHFGIERGGAARLGLDSALSMELERLHAAAAAARSCPVRGFNLFGGLYTASGSTLRAAAPLPDTVPLTLR
ncbi:FAD-dependent monooxygenase [Caldimonas brevitalea]|uniref:2-polyprenyl-6-methoxyphenol hydroxylase n=1 Tax=Caldimonas brevitalea TaxID=413882 RepID=A0A0G3BN32_9BURK|nr:FAD-dependent monooxygenase [Caldimonas brevitalea]AKJ30859.1 2-polyprenyl-6-methoxyphenol hydroxylase [Caldimonas brevitalea]